jgi:hypothetical protein
VATASSSSRQREQNRGGEAPWPPAWGGVSSSYRAPNVTWFLPMRSRRQEESDLLTYDGGNRRWRAGGDGAALSVFNGGGNGFRWCSDSGNGSGGTVGGRDSSKQQLSARGLDSTGQECELRRLWLLGFGWRQRRVKLLSTHSLGGLWSNPN